MGARSRELILLLAVCTLAISEAVNKTVKKDKKDSDNFLYQYEDYESGEDQEVLFSENKPCPRDCICTLSQGCKIAKCNRLEVGTQKFGDDVTDLVIENTDPIKAPIKLDDFIFKKLGLHQIATIKIINSTIASVGPKAFDGLHELYAINLSNNNLKTLDPETFANNKKLLLLTISNNPLKFPASGSQEYFLNSSSVQELDVSYCNMQYVTTNTFKNMPGLMYLNLAGNNLSDMDADAFKKLLDLEEIDLSDNVIQTLPDDLFSENSELATLHIQVNPISSVYGLQISDLLTLNAGQTQIQFVGPSMFNGMTYIANLNLSYNSIEKIHNQAFHKLVELNYLDLSHNDLDFISGSLIKENIELDIFKIAYNPGIKHLPVDGFNCSAEQFNIYLFDASVCGLEEVYDDSLKTFTALSQINLSYNAIKSVNTKVFSHCPKLVDINLSYNMLNALEDKVFERNKELSKLNLQGNPLKVLSSQVFIHTPLLTWLDVSHAEITSLWKVEKSQPTILSNLSFLNVSNNRITEVKQTELDNLYKLRTFDISNNMLACSRDFEDLMTWLTKHKVSPNANPANSANFAKVTKDEDVTYNWDFLVRKTCSTEDQRVIITAEPEQAPVSDEEIWERFDQDEVGNFDLKRTLDDAKVAEEPKLTQNTTEKSIDDEDADEDAEEDDAELEDDEDDEEAFDGEYDDDLDLKVKLIEKASTTTPTPKPVSELTQKDKMALGIKLLDNEMLYDEIDSAMYVKGMIMKNTEDGYDYLWPIMMAVLGVLILLVLVVKAVMVICSKRNRQIRYNSAIIAAMSHPGRTKKDCGLVYQQLSEDLTGPKTPKLNRYAPLHNVTVNASNMSYESSPFHHNNIVPEAV